jgi:cytochrome c oxidase subunit 2
VQKWWSLLFGVIMILATALFIIAPFAGWWLPVNVSTFGPAVDNLFYIILGITGFFFILTESLLVYFMYTYAGEPGRHGHVFGAHYAESKVLWTSFFKRIFRPVSAVINNQHRLELAWTFVPAVILLFIAFAQISTWEEIKYQSRMPRPDQPVQQMEVSARQFEWRIRYPSPERMAAWEKDPADAKSFATNLRPDDIHVVNEVHTWSDQRVLVALRTRDVIHSFYLPNLRLKQDALPGKTIPVWFEVNKVFNTKKQGDVWVDGDGRDPKTGEPSNPAKVWELACAELCGWGHYKMTGRLYVHKDKADFLEWLQSARAAQDLAEPPPSSVAAR